MEKDPMWTDKLDERETVELRPFPSRQEEQLFGEHGVRIVTSRGVVYEGVATFGRLRSLLDPLVINGKRFSRTAHTVHVLDPAHVVVRDYDPVELSDGEVRDLIVDENAKHASFHGKAPAARINEIVRAAIGFDPTNGVPERDYGGLTKDGYINQFLRVAALRKSLERLEADGAIRKAVSGRDSNDDSYVSMHGKVGYLTVEAYNEAVAFKNAANHTAIVERLRLEAARTVAARHQDEVEAELTRLLGVEGLTR